VVEGFQGRGVTFVNDIRDVPAGGIVVYSAHGISPEVRRAAKERGLVEVDATCPLVTKVHMEVLRYAREGYTILFVGHRNHDEAVGTVGEAPQNVVIVESAEEVENVTVPDSTKVAFVTQTTLSVSDAERVIAAIKQRFPYVRYPEKDDICYATTNRQSAVTQLAAEAQVVLVVGSQNSSNSKRLVERAAEQGKPAYLIDDDSEIDLNWFDGKQSVLVTAGASAPEHIVQNVVNRLVAQFGGTVEQRTLVEEDVFFDLPKSAKKLAVIS
jgi:4-hydroxy-3-methylbut-2-enyl diphosphate reductase